MENHESCYWMSEHGSGCILFSNESGLEANLLWHLGIRKKCSAPRTLNFMVFLALSEGCDVSEGEGEHSLLELLTLPETRSYRDDCPMAIQNGGLEPLLYAGATGLASNHSWTLLTRQKMLGNNDSLNRHNSLNHNHKSPIKVT